MALVALAPLGTRVRPDSLATKAWAVRLRSPLASPIQGASGQAGPLRGALAVARAAPPTGDDSKTPKAARKVAPAGDSSSSSSISNSSRNVAKRAASDTVAPEEVKHAPTWAAGAPMPFSFLAGVFDAIARTTKRTEITGHLSSAFCAVVATTPGDLLPAAYLSTGSVAPAHAGVELGIGDATLIKALAQASGHSEEDLRQEALRRGDLGEVAAAQKASRGAGASAQLTVREVYETFLEIAGTSGKSTQERRKALIVRLLQAAQPAEASYIIRTLQGKLRVGAGEQTMLTALAHAVAAHQQGQKAVPKKALEEAAQLVKQAFGECPSYHQLIPAMLQHPLAELPQHVHFTPGVPIKPMLAKPTTGVSELVAKLSGQEFSCEYKYDGERAQVHVTQGGAVRVFSRNCEDNTGRFPDLVAHIPKLLKPGVNSVVLDGEVVASDRSTGKVLPFQTLSTRARKDVKVEDIRIQVCIFAFDCLYLNGRTLLREPLTARRQALLSAINTDRGILEIATSKTSHDVEELQLFLEEAVTAGTEGLIVKTLADTYEPSKRSTHWLKLKKDYLEGLGDTFDLVPIGAWWGNGKRAGVYGSYLLAVYDPEGNQFQTICRTGTGFSEEQLRQLTASLVGTAIQEPHPNYSYSGALAPDVWFDARAVWEVKAADLSKSPVHRAAAAAEADRGISIRSPRLVRVRQDKGPRDATTAQQVYEMYRQQLMLPEQDGAPEAATKEEGSRRRKAGD